MRKVAILLSGRGSNMMALVEQASGYRVVLVASDNPAAPGLDWARERGLATFALSPKGIGKPAYEAALDAALRGAGTEMIALAGYMRLLPNDFVARWRGRIVNIHPSLLPKYKGLDTHARAIAAGDDAAGCSVHLVTEELDGGAVLAQSGVAILPGDTPDSLAARVLVAEHALYPATLAEFVRMSPNPDTRPDAALVRLRAIALGLPEAAEKLSHGSPAFFIEQGDAFAYFRHDEQGDGSSAVIVKTAGREEQKMLVEQDGEFYSIPPDLGAAGWIAIHVGKDNPDWDQIADRVAQSWELVAPSRLLEAGGR